MRGWTEIGRSQSPKKKRREKRKMGKKTPDGTVRNREGGKRLKEKGKEAHSRRSAKDY